MTGCNKTLIKKHATEDDDTVKISLYKCHSHNNYICSFQTVFGDEDSLNITTDFLITHDLEKLTEKYNRLIDATTYAGYALIEGKS